MDDAADTFMKRVLKSGQQFEGPLNVFWLISNVCTLIVPYVHPHYAWCFIAYFSIFTLY
jgi:hypothetical protein